MLGSSIAWILILSGAATAVGGLAAFVFPKPLLRLAFGIHDPEAWTAFFIRHWGILLFVVGALIVFSAYAPATRVPVLTAAAIEKVGVVLLIFFGPLKRTGAMTAIAIADGAFAALYITYLLSG